MGDFRNPTVLILAIGLCACSPYTARNNLTLGVRTEVLSQGRIFSPSLSEPNYSQIPPTPSNNINQPISTVCTDTGVANMKGSVVTSKTLKLLFIDQATSEVVCELSDPSIREVLINERRLSFENPALRCPNIGKSRLWMDLRAEDSETLITAPIAGPGNYVNGEGYEWLGIPAKVAVALGNFWYSSPVPVPYLSFSDAQTASQDTPVVLYNTNPNGSNFTGATAECTGAGSPLLLQLKPAQKIDPISLSPPLNGVKFDILGSRSLPAPHTKKQISWLSGASAAGNYFIVLPNALGQVDSVDEMFGDNTAGPDETYAANGYEALRKWDGRKLDGTFDPHVRDGHITRADPVYSQLRLWSDTNGDGSAQATELRTLTEMSVTDIDLNYDSGFREVDRYGNEIKMKSVAQTADGSYHVMYDIWFRIID